MLDVVELRKWWDIFVGDGNFTEIRIIGRFQYSGYFKDFDNLCAQLEPYTNMDDEQIYFVLNSIDKDCYARPQCEKFVKSPKTTTTDSDVIRKKFLLLDFDPIRKSQTNSSDAQFELAHKKAQDVYRFLIREHGFTDSIICISGNGWHILVPVDLPCDDETNKIVKNFYTYMGSIFSDNEVEFDEKVYTNARLTKLYSTWAKKGANLPSNPWRQSKIVYIPKELKPTPIEKIKELADLAPKEEPKLKQKVNSFNERFDLEQWLNTYGIEYRKKQDGSSTKYEIKTCPWHTTHSVDNPYSSAIYQDADGKVTYTCAHSHCSDKQWKDFRLFYQPDAYNRPAYQPQQVVYVQQPKVQRPKYEIKDEIPELGEKWLSMSSIKKVDISSLEHVKTGFAELDKSILGLFMTEVTILSGSNSSGKSSWLNTLILNVIQQGYNVALWSGELPAYILKAWISMAAAGKRYLKPSQYDDGKFYVPDSIGQKIDQWLDGKFFLFNNEYGNKWLQIFHDMELLIQNGVKIFVLDNLFSLDIDILDGDKNSKQRELILKIKEFAKTKQVHVIIVAHPRKVTTFLRKNDISGSSDLQNAVDKILIIHRVNNDFFRTGAEFFGQSEIQRYQSFGNVVEVCKERMFGIVDLLVGMYYEIESRRFKNTLDEEVHYGWEETYEQQAISFQPRKTYEPQHDGRDLYMPMEDELPEGKPF